MTRIHTRFVGRGLICGCISIAIAFLIGVAACQTSIAQGQRPPRRGQPGAAGPLDRLGGFGGTMSQREEEVEPDPAEPEENVPEREYAEMPVDESVKRTMPTSTLNDILSRGKFETPAERDLFDEYLTKYLLPRWSRVKGPKKDDITNFPKERRDFRNYQAKQKRGVTEVHDHLNELTLDFMKKLVVGDYHPAARVNAMLMIGELNRVEPSGGQPAVPLPEALTILLKAADETRFPTGIRAAAMIGVLRHAKAGVQDEEAKKSLGDSMVKLATSDRPSGAAASGHAWLVAQSTETLGVLGSVGENGTVFQTLVKTVADEKLPFFARSAAAESLGRLSYPATVAISPVEAAGALGQYAIDICADELRLTKSASSSVSRRRMLQRLDAVRSALDGVEDANSKGITSLAREPGHKAFVAELQKLIKDACELLDNKDVDDKKMKSAVEKLQKDLKTWAGKTPK